MFYVSVNGILTLLRHFRQQINLRLDRSIFTDSNVPDNAHSTPEVEKDLFWFFHTGTKSHKPRWKIAYFLTLSVDIRFSLMIACHGLYYCILQCPCSPVRALNVPELERWWIWYSVYCLKLQSCPCPTKTISHKGSLSLFSILNGTASWVQTLPRTCCSGGDYLDSTITIWCVLLHYAWDMSRSGYIVIE